MALAITNRAQFGSSAPVPSRASSSFTPSANSKLYVCAWTESMSGVATLSVTNTGGLTFFDVTGANVTPGMYPLMRVFEAEVGSSPSAMTITVVSGTWDSEVSAAVFDVTGNNPHIKQIIPRVATVAGGGNMTSGTLPAAATNGNLSVLFTGINTDAFASPTTPAGWNVVAKMASGGGTYEKVGVFSKTDFTGTSVTFASPAGENLNYGIALFEFEEGPYVVATGAPVSGATATTIAFTLPSYIPENSRIWFASNINQASASEITSVTNLTEVLVDSQSQSAVHTAQLMTAPVGSANEGQTVTVTWSVSGRVELAWIIVNGYQATQNTLAAATDNTDDIFADVPAITPTIDNALLVDFVLGRHATLGTFFSGHANWQYDAGAVGSQGTTPYLSAHVLYRKMGAGTANVAVNEDHSWDTASGDIIWGLALAPVVSAVVPTATLKASGEFGLNTTVGGALTSTTLAPITFQPKSLVVVVLGEVKSDAAASDLSASTPGLVFGDRAHASQLATSRADQAIFTAWDVTGGSRAIAISSGVRKSAGLFYAVYEVMNAEWPVAIGANATNTAQTLDGPVTMTLSAAPAANSLIIAAMMVDTDPGLNTVDPGSTFTESVEIDSAGGTNYGVMQVQTRTGSTSTTVDWADVRAGASAATYSTAGAAIEIFATDGVLAPGDFGYGDWLLEDGSGGWQLEDGSGLWLLDTQESAPASGTAATGTASLALTGTNSGVSAATVSTASMTLSASGGGRATMAGSGSLTISGTAVARAATTATASLTLSGVGVVRSAIVGSGALVMSGTGAARAPTAGTASLSLSATGTADAGPAAVTGTASLTLSGAGSAAATTAATASLTLTGTGAARAAISAAASLTVSGAGTAGATAPAGTASLTVSGTGTSQTVVTGTGSLTLSGAGAIRATLAGSGSLTVSGTGTAGYATSATASLTVSGSGAATTQVTGSASLAVSGTGTAAFSSGAAASLTIAGVGTAQTTVAGSGSLAVSGSGAARGAVAGSASLSLSGSGAAGYGTSGTASLSLSGSGTTAVRAVGSASLSVVGTAVAAVRAAATAALSLTATGTAQAAQSSIGTLTITGTGAAQTLVTGTGSLTLSGAGALATQAAASASLSLTGTGSGTSYSAITGTASLTLLGGRVEEHSIWGDDAPPGSTWRIYNDGAQGIVLGMNFYQTSGAGQQVIGGRVWIPSGWVAPPNITIMAWIDTTDEGNNLNTAPVRSVTVSVPAGDNWAEAMWEPFDMPDDGKMVMIGYRFAGPLAGDDDYYVAATDGFSVGETTPIQAEDGSEFFIAKMVNFGHPSGSQRRQYYIQDSGPGVTINSPASSTVSYGIDILVGVRDQASASAIIDGSGSLSLSGSGAAAVRAAGSGSLTFNGSGVQSSVGSGSISLSGSASMRAVAAATASLSLAGTGTAGYATTGTGSLTLTAVGVARGVTTSFAALSVVGTGTVRAALTGAASMAVSGAITVGARAVGSASISLLAEDNSDGSYSASASGSLQLSGSATPAAPVTGTGSLALSGAGATSARAAATASMSLSASGAARATPSGTASLSITATGATKSPAAASAALTLTGAGTTTTPITGTGSITFSGGTSPLPVAVTGAGSLSFAGSAASTSPAAGTASITLSGAGVLETRGTASLTVTAAGAARGRAFGSASVSLAGAGGAGIGRSGTASLSLSAVGAATTRAAASASLSLTGAGTALSQAAITGNAALTLAGAGALTSQGAAGGAASLSLSASGASAARAAANASLNITAQLSGGAAYAAIATLSLTATGTVRGIFTSFAALSLNASGTAATSVTGTGSLSLNGTGSGAVLMAASGTAFLELVATGSALSYVQDITIISVRLRTTWSGTLRTGDIDAKLRDVGFTGGIRIEPQDDALLNDRVVSGSLRIDPGGSYPTRPGSSLTHS